MDLEKTHFVITGPESSGKTTLFESLKSTFDGFFIEEYAREYLNNNNNRYDRKDLRTIAFHQFQQQLSAYNSLKSTIVSDTCLLSILIWDEYKYGQMDEFIWEWFQLQQVDFYLLCKPDLEWEPDPMRENEHEREELYEIYKQKILEFGVPFIEIEGRGEGRVERAKDIISQNLCTQRD